MSVFIGSVRGPSNNSPHDAGEVWSDASGVSFNLFDGDGGRATRQGVSRRLDPVAARNLAALLVRAAEASEQMRSGRGESIARGIGIDRDKLIACLYVAIITG